MVGEVADESFELNRGAMGLMTHHTSSSFGTALREDKSAGVGKSTGFLTQLTFRL